MKTDRYTKVLLTVITVCLVLIVLKLYDPVSSANATPAVAAAPSLAPQNNVVDVRIVDGVGYNKKINEWCVYSKSR